MITAEKQGSVEVFFTCTGKSKENYSSELRMRFSLLLKFCLITF